MGPGGVLVQHFDPAAAARHDPKLTPGDVFTDATAEDVGLPGYREVLNLSGGSLESSQLRPSRSNG
jgi:hypothetical protein